MIKLCVDCRWARIFDPQMSPERQYWQCYHPTAEIPAVTNLVTGKITPATRTGCEIVRALNRGPDDRQWCGPDGKFWEAIGFGR